MDKLENKSLSLFELVRIIRFNIKKILIATLIVGVLSAFIAFFVLIPVFFSSSTVKSTSKGGGLGALLGGLDVGSGLGDFVEGGTTSASKELALYEDILTSRKCIEETIVKFNLNSEWEYKYMQDAVKNFRDNIMELASNKQSGVMFIGVYDKKPERAKEIVDFLIYQLNKMNVELNVQNARNNRVFIEERYLLSKKELEQAEDSLESFQNIYGVAPDLTIRAAVQGQIQIETEIKSEEVKLDILKKILTHDQPEIKAQEEKIKALYKQLEIIKNSETGNNNLSLKGSPNVAMDFLRLQRNVEIQTKILTFILPLFEQAKIEENKETPSVIIMDPSFLPEKKAKPKRMTIVLVCMFLTFALMSTFYIIKYKYIEATSDSKI
ncbi:MAG TPA: GNVR domain-containing protein [Ignavibacteria bacterium]|nr:GNVR domain-containing protein [Ignavibacteria bacterium]